MPSVRIHREQKDQLYFVTFTVKNWYYLFDRFNRFEILEQSFVYCQKQKGLEVFAFVFMLNHLHFIGRAQDLSAVIRDMKSFLAKQFKKNIHAHEPGLLKLFTQDGTFSLWQKANYPKLINSEKFFRQKVQYIHNNPVAKQYVHQAEDYRWSSASKIGTGISISLL